MKWLKLLDNNILKLYLLFFAFFIPLFPKIPFKHVEYTYISVRPDDLAVAGLVIIFFIQLLRKKIQFNEAFLRPFLFFWFAVMASYIWNVHIVETMPYKQVAFLHALRRIEYLIIFFIASSAIKSKNDFKLLLSALFSSFFLVVIYGISQKFLGFPAVQTMNPAFAQGIILLLTPEARISGTFAGHYDLAAYLVFLIPIIAGMHLAPHFISISKKQELLIAGLGIIVLSLTAINLRITNSWIIVMVTAAPLVILPFIKEKVKAIYFSFLLIFMGITLLVFTASRISFLSFLASTPLFLLFMRKYKYFIVVVIFTVVAFSMSKNLSNRFSKTFQVKQILVNEKTGEVYVPQEISTRELPAGSAYIQLSKGGKQVITDESSVYKQKVIQERIIKDKQLSQKQKDELIATLSANIKPIQSLSFDISQATRFQIEWPRAIGAFITSPVFGTGPFSITEATDNDYLRVLGEFGFLGFAAFVYLLFSLARFVFVKTRQMDLHDRPLFLAILFGLFGLLINATYIDVFEASKVAYIFWLMFGVFIGYLKTAWQK